MLLDVAPRPASKVLREIRPASNRSGAQRVPGLGWADSNTEETIPSALIPARRRISRPGVPAAREPSRRPEADHDGRAAA